jgi:glycosyltransferase involved in cell wall biosynthesis
MKQLFYDVSELSKFDKGTGIQRVTRAILDELFRSPPIGWNIIPVRGDVINGHFYPVVMEFDSQQNTDLDPIAPVSGDLFLSVDLAYNISQILRDELLKFKGLGTHIFFVIHDLIPIRYPEWFKGTNDWFEGNDYLELFNFWFKTVYSVSDGLICVSETVEDDVKAWFKETAIHDKKWPETGWFHHGSNVNASIPSHGLPENAEKVIAKLEQRQTFLMVGTVEPRKGHHLALEAFELLWKKGYEINLVIVGRAGWKIENLLKRIQMHKQLGEYLFWLDGISDEYLEKIYNHSTVLLALSEAEGFGLPLIEAAYHKLPIIARDIAVFREVCQNGAFYVKADNAIELRQQIENWMQQFNRSAHPKSINVKPQSWKESTRQLCSVIENIQHLNFRWQD